MRVLLVVSTHLYKYFYPSFLSVSNFPIGFAYLAAALRSAGHEVYGLNLNNDASYSSAYEMVSDRMSRSIKEIQPELIGLGGLCTDFTFLKDVIQIIRKIAQGVPIVCGGGIINNDAEFVFSTLKPDFCIVGEGEEILVELANMLESGKYDYEQIDNLGYWKNGVVHFTKENFNYVSIDKRHFPDYEPFKIEEMLDTYSMATPYLCRYTRQNPRPMTIVTARGCPFNCTFCVHRKGPEYRERSIQNIIDEIALLYGKYHFNILIIADELFAVRSSRIKEFSSALCQARKDYRWDFDWLFQAHASVALDREALELAKASGCYLFSYGLESASPRILGSMNKKNNPQQIIKTIETANSVGIGFSGNFIFGDRAETLKTVRETMDFFSRYCLDIHISLRFIQPYPGSKLFEESMDRGIIRDKLEFYEHIDERIWNLTSIPDRLWLPWISLLFYLAKFSSWVKSTDAFSCDQDRGMTTNYSGKLLYHVRAQCPHCGKDIYYKEFLGKAKRNKSFLCFKYFQELIVKTARVSHNGLTKMYPRFFIKNVFFYYLSFRHPLFRLLKIVMADQQRSLFFITGCTNCNKRIQINVPITDFSSRLGLVIRRLICFFATSIAKIPKRPDGPRDRRVVDFRD